MPDYNFQTLNDREFEKLSRDLIQKELSLTFESFKPGRDGGIDLRHISPNENSQIIVQVKHRTRSSFDVLFSHLKNEELVKVKKIKPSRYILVASIELNPAQKEKILKLFSPFILTPGDILGKDDINGLLGKFHDIEINHPKLWLSSVPILRKIINNGIRGRSDFTAENIIKNVSLYIANEKYAESLDVLAKEQFLVIIGEPGIGKTVLAKMLIYQLLGKDYKLIAIGEKISEAEDLWDQDQKQVFYFDDFLGANYLEIAQHHNSDSALVNFINRIKSDPKKKLILTSRTTILNHASQIYPKLDTPSINLAKHEVKIGDYSQLDKAQILYNHLYFLGLDNEYKNKIKEDSNYWKIIKHKNFNPRLIEFISDPLRLKDTPPQDYMNFIQERLDNPADVWKHAYQYQIDSYSKFILQTLFSLGEKTNEITLKKAFNARLDYEIVKNGFKREADIFTLRTKELLGGFLKAERSGNEVKFDFFNPSIVDFLIHLLRKDSDEKWRILESVIFTSQLNSRFTNLKDSTVIFLETGVHKTDNYISFTDLERLRLHQLLLSKENELLNIVGGSPSIDLINFYYFAFPIKNNIADIARIISTLNFENVLPSQAQSLLSNLETLSEHNTIFKTVKSRWREIIDYLFSSSSDKGTLVLIHELFQKYDENYSAYTSNENSRAIIENSLNRYWNKEIEELENGYDMGENFEDLEEAENYIDNIHYTGEKFNKSLGFIDLPVMNGLSKIDIDNIFEINKQHQEEAMAEDAMSDYHKESYYAERSQEREVEKEINDLFQ